MPPQAKVSNVKFSPDGSRLAFLNTKDAAIELWIADGLTGAAKPIVTGADRINATRSDPCDWLRDNKTMICELVPAGRGAAPAEPTVPSGPNVAGELRQGGACTDLRGSAEDGSRRQSLQLLLHQPADGAST